MRANPWPIGVRAIRLFKQLNSEKAERLGKAIVERTHGGGEVVTEAGQQVDDAVAHSGHHFGSGALADPTGVFPHRHIPPIMQAVLDAPMAAGQRE